MRITRVALLTGAAAIVLAGYAGLAEARPQAPAVQAAQTHVVTLQLPDGQIEQVRYVGDVPPAVVLTPAAMTVSLDPVAPFAMLERIEAAMDQQAAAMLQALDGMPMAIPALGTPGAIPAMSGPGVCMESVQITYNGNGQAPHVVTRTAGRCGPVQRPEAPVALPDAPVMKRAPNVIEAKAAPRYDGLIRTVSDVQR